MSKKTREFYILAFRQSDKYFDKSVSLVERFFKNDPKKVSLWFFAYNPLLGDIRPVDMFLMGRSEKLLDFIVNQKDEGGW